MDLLDDYRWRDDNPLIAGAEHRIGPTVKHRKVPRQLFSLQGKRDPCHEIGLSYRCRDVGVFLRLIGTGCGLEA